MVPPPAVWPDKLVSTSREPEKLPRAEAPLTLVPVSALCNCRPLPASEPRIEGAAGEPVRSAATTTAR